MQSVIENTHNEMNAIMIAEHVETDELYTKMERNRSIQAKVKWIHYWKDTRHGTFAEQIIAAAVNNSVFSATNYYIMSNIKQNDTLYGLCYVNELINHDNEIHCRFMCVVHELMQCKVLPLTIHTIIDDAVEIEKNYADS